MSTISKDRDILTLINVFTVVPEKQRELVALLVDATKQTMQHLPGFISASIHRSFDGKKVVNYAQWRSKADFEAMQKNPKAIPHMQAAAAIAQFDPILCEVSDALGVA
jgi:quinol monooxygenase YgiN